jgi:hypothetical protein
MSVSEKTAHLSKLLESMKWRVMGYKGDDADGQPLTHPVRIQNAFLRGDMCTVEQAYEVSRIHLRMLAGHEIRGLRRAMFQTAGVATPPDCGPAASIPHAAGRRDPTVYAGYAGSTFYAG